MPAMQESAQPKSRQSRQEKNGKQLLASVLLSLTLVLGTLWGSYHSTASLPMMQSFHSETDHDMQSTGQSCLLTWIQIWYCGRQQHLDSNSRITSNTCPMILRLGAPTCSASCMQHAAVCASHVCLKRNSVLLHILRSICFACLSLIFAKNLFAADLRVHFWRCPFDTPFKSK